MAEFRLILSFSYLDPNLEALYPNGNQEWSEEEPYEEDRRFINEDEAWAMYQEAKEILARDDASDMEPSQAQQDFPIKHGIEMCDIDGNDYGAKLALIEIVDFLRVENLMIEDEED